jgi:hypothetical protein
MFSLEQKKHIAEVIEKTLLEMNHPEMPTEKPLFQLHVDGKESWSWADISPNWIYDDKNKPNINPFNEMVAETMKRT